MEWMGRKRSCSVRSSEAGKTRPVTKSSGGKSSAPAQQEKNALRVASASSRREEPSPRETVCASVCLGEWVGVSGGG